MPVCVFVVSINMPFTYKHLYVCVSVCVSMCVDTSISKKILSHRWMIQFFLHIK